MFTRMRRSFVPFLRLFLLLLLLSIICCGLDKAQSNNDRFYGCFVIHDTEHAVCAHITAHSLKIELRAFEKLVYNLIIPFRALFYSRPWRKEKLWKMQIKFITRTTTNIHSIIYMRIQNRIDWATAEKAYGLLLSTSCILPFTCYMQYVQLRNEIQCETAC